MKTSASSANTHRGYPSGLSAKRVVELEPPAGEPSPGRRRLLCCAELRRSGEARSETRGDSLTRPERHRCGVGRASGPGGAFVGGTRRRRAVASLFALLLFAVPATSASAQKAGFFGS